jgi:iron(III) transport system permease protein
MVSIGRNAAGRPGAAIIKPKVGREAWSMRALMALIGVYLLITLALPLYTMLSKSFDAYTFRFEQIGVEGLQNGVWQDAGTIRDWIERSGGAGDGNINPSARTRLGVGGIIPRSERERFERWRFRDNSAGGKKLLYEGKLSATGQWFEVVPEDLRKLRLLPAPQTSLRNYAEYFSTPALRQSIANSLLMATITTLITVTLAFSFAYALTRSCMPYKGLFKTIAMVPILVPSLLPGIALV